MSASGSRPNGSHAQAVAVGKRALAGPARARRAHRGAAEPEAEHEQCADRRDAPKQLARQCASSTPRARAASPARCRGPGQAAQGEQPKCGVGDVGQRRQVERCSTSVETSRAARATAAQRRRQQDRQCCRAGRSQANDCQAKSDGERAEARALEGERRGPTRRTAKGTSAVGHQRRGDSTSAATSAAVANAPCRRSPLDRCGKVRLRLDRRRAR